MIQANEHYNKLKASYLFADIAKRVEQYQLENPEKQIIKLGIGDVTNALCPAVIKGFHAGVDEMANDATFHGYGPSPGYEFLRKKIAKNDFQDRGADIQADEIFVSDGAKCDTGNFQELFSTDIKVAIPDPVYPAYLDTNVMAGRTGEFENGRYNGIVYMDCTKENNFMPELPNEKVDLIYLCFPNNPTGSTATKKELEKWVNYAKDNKALILFDAAYEAFVRDDNLPRTIYEIEGAKQVAVEFRSFSKTAGFTGTRCGFIVVPKECMIFNAKNENYLKNADIIRKAVESLGFDYVGGKHSPYIWINGKEMNSWDFFDLLLNKASVVCTPGAGFGRCGEKYIRISAFNSLENVTLAMERIKKALTSRSM